MDVSLFGIHRHTLNWIDIKHKKPVTSRLCLESFDEVCH